jgi:hypothetical protein
MLAQRKRGMDRASEMLEDIRRIRAMNTLDCSPVVLPRADALFVESFLRALASLPLDERIDVALSAEQRKTIDRLRKEHGIS